MSPYWRPGAPIVGFHYCSYNMHHACETNRPSWELGQPREGAAQACRIRGSGGRLGGMSSDGVLDDLDNLMYVREEREVGWVVAGGA